MEGKVNNIIVKGTNAEKFTSELWQKITETGFNNLSKNDIYDYILYLYNNFSNVSFLDKNSNYENALILKVTENKLKTSKINIALKFQAADERRKTIRSLFMNIASGAISIEDKKDYFEFTVENPVARIELENILKVNVGNTLEYCRNRERVKLEKYNMFFILKEIAKCSDAKMAEIIKSELSTRELKAKIKSSASTLFEKIGGVLKEISVSVLSGVITNALT